MKEAHNKQLPPTVATFASNSRHICLIIIVSIICLHKNSTTVTNAVGTYIHRRTQLEYVCKMYLAALVDGLNVLAHLVDRVGDFKEVVLSDVDSRCQLRRHLAQLCADDVVLFHNTHTHTHTHTRINQPALHLKHPLLLNLASTASSGLHKLLIAKLSSRRCFKCNAGC